MTRRTLAEAVQSGDNSFLLARLVGAVLVAIYHSFALTGHVAPGQDVTGISFGSLAVLSFFGVSGCLITYSWMRDPRPRVFLAKRALRIVPGLAACALLMAFVLGPLVTGLSPGDYFADTGPYAFLLRVSALVTFNPFLPGVFEGNPVPEVVNGSLWTIPLDACCYVALLVAGVIGALRHPRILAVLLLGLVLLMLLAAPPEDPTGIREPTGIDVILNALRPCGAFLAGSLMWLWRDRVPMHPGLALLAGAALFVPGPIEVHSAIDIVAVPYLVLWLGSRRLGLLSVLTSPGDVSYGVFIYAYPIQQTLVELVPGIGPAAMMALSLPAAYIAGLLSWRIVEHPATRLGGRLRGRAGVPAASPVG